MHAAVLPFAERVRYSSDRLEPHVIDRCNLTALLEPGQMAGASSGCSEALQ